MEPKKILHETKNMYLNSKLEICLNGASYAVVVGKANSIEQAKRCMERLERYPENLRRMCDHV